LFNKLVIAVILIGFAPRSYADIVLVPGTGSISTQTGAGTIQFSPSVAAASGNSDDFNAADSTPIDTNDPNWVLMTAQFTSTVDDCVITGNTARTVSAWAYCSAMYNTSSSDVSQIVFKAYSDASVGKRVCVRGGGGASANKTGYCAIFAAGSGGNWTEVVINKDNGYLDSWALQSHAQASDHTMKIKASGTSPVTIEVFVDGSSLGTKTDSTSPIASGKPGFYMVGNGDATVTGMDNWQDFE
jgi:hypothetical protein